MVKKFVASILLIFIYEKLEFCFTETKFKFFYNSKYFPTLDRLSDFLLHFLLFNTSISIYFFLNR